MEFPGLSFSPGRDVQAEILAKFGASVTHCSVDRLSFALVASFGRSKFKLSADSVGFLLQAALGGVAAQFAVVHFNDRSFKFWVSSKSVGFFVARLRYFSCPSFVVHFNFWGNGGPDWQRELEDYLRVEELSWTPASSKSRATSKTFAEVVKSSPPLSGANAVPVGVPRRRHPPLLVFNSKSALPPRRSAFDRLTFPSRAGLQVGLQPRSCSRCLSSSHSRAQCSWPIRCRACGTLGHVAASCMAPVVMGVAMAFQRTDPTPFIPTRMEYEEVPDRVFMVRTVAPMHPPPRNEDLAIVTIEPLPGNPMLFGNVRGVIRDFLRMVRDIPFEDIQPSSLGQALVQLTHPYHRDVLVAESPHVFGDVLLTFTRHNQGRNWRRSEFNQECWLLLLGFPNDYWTERLIHSAVGTFARILLIVANPKHKTRLLLKVRIKEARLVPQFIVMGDPDTPLDESWTTQVEILQVNHQGDAPPPEEQIPVNLDPEIGVPFDFIGLGQPLQLVQGEQQQNDLDGWEPWPVGAEQNNDEEGQNLDGWDAWPPEVQQMNADDEALMQNAQGPVEILHPEPLIPDLNIPLDEQDLDPILKMPEECNLSVTCQTMGNSVQQLEAQSEATPVLHSRAQQQALHMHLPEEDDFIQSILAQRGIQAQLQNSNIQTQMGSISSGPFGQQEMAHDIEAETGRLMRKFFPSGNGSELVINISKQWAPFFIKLLLSPSNFVWTKQFLSSKAPVCLLDNPEDCCHINIPSSCPNANLQCLSTTVEEVQKAEEGCSKKLPLKKRNRKELAIVESEVRRSKRLTGITKGFKFSICSKISCFACKSMPPSTRTKALKKLAIDFCGLSESEVNSNVLQPKRKKASPIGRPKLGKKKMEGRSSSTSKSMEVQMDLMASTESVPDTAKEVDQDKTT
ncbi:hypothetical protein SORBI_3005G207900 [Sorghum bicolor]|uniref:DUF7597 domain-containing protein n=1 Tax=Sorghum bicolor TaxID=4558 RepID=A0A1B6PTU4_SORBI|nr:hypothetical protein SORBI_3005G207900 [Sorghum bicolor]